MRVLLPVMMPAEGEQVSEEEVNRVLLRDVQQGPGRFVVSLKRPCAVGRAECAGGVTPEVVASGIVPCPGAVLLVFSARARSFT